MRRAARAWVVVLSVVAGSMAGCNSLLDNREGILLESTRAAGDPTTPFAEGRATEDAADATPPSTDVPDAIASIDAGVDAMPDAGSPDVGPPDAACEQGYADCNLDPSDGCERDLSLVTSCGACAVVCPGVTNGAAACVEEQCTFACDAQFHACGGTCREKTDPTACGEACTECPTPPNAAASCDGVACGFTCAEGFDNCDGNAENGCETTLAIDPLHCGACGKSCDGLPCVEGVCLTDAGAP
jgi:hypothetical protein